MDKVIDKHVFSLFDKSKFSINVENIVQKTEIFVFSGYNKEDYLIDA